MELVLWWLLPIWLAIIVFVVWRYMRRRKSSKKHQAGAIPIAHTERLRNLPRYAKAYRRYRQIVLVVFGLLAISIVSVVLLSARPIAQNLVTPQQKSRDIMLCLDVSGSMDSIDASVFTTFNQLVNSFAGQRVGLVAFNSAAVTVFPLTDDYDLIKSYLQQGQSGFGAIKDGQLPDFGSQESQDYDAIVDGTFSNDDAGSSIIGDGIASCVNRMGDNEQKRSQSIVLATDNEAEGTEIITTPQAAAFAKQKGIRIYAIAPPVTDDVDAETGASSRAELKQAALLTGGAYFEVGNVNVQDIIGQISKQEAVLFSAPPELVQTDVPGPLLIVLTIALLGVCVLAWRLRL